MTSITKLHDSILTKRIPKTRSLYEKLSMSVFWAKIFRWEFWPFSVLYFPVIFYWIWMSLRTRSFFFFTASNPTIEFGGMLGESKNKIFDLIPDRYIPMTFKLAPSSSTGDVKGILAKKQMNFPIILKPDIGERGWMVELIKNEEALKDYLDKVSVDFLVQEYVPYEVELGVFYYRYPDRKNGTISSIVMKEMLSVIGDGRTSVYNLMNHDVRTKMHQEALAENNPKLMDYVPKYDEKVELVSIGNHCKGTTFLDGNELITDRLIKVFDHVSRQIDGFYFGRYDVRCRSIEDLYDGKNFKILELNGAGAEPGHIYQPGYSLIQAYKDILHHLKVLMEISMINRKKGIPYLKFWDGVREIQRINRYNKRKTST